MPYLLLIEKADSFKFAPREAKNQASCSSGEISNKNNGQFLVQISWKSQIMNLSLQTQKADSFKFAPLPEKLLY